MNKNTIILSIISVLILGMYSCVPQTSSTSNICPEGTAFDAKSRTCVDVSLPPVATLQEISIDEDSTNNIVVLSYKDVNKEYAQSCNIVVAKNLTAGLCRCTGGECNVSITPTPNFPEKTDSPKYGEIQYTVTDDDGTSNVKVVRVNIQNIDDKPVGTKDSFAFNESTSTINNNGGSFELSYTDIDSTSAPTSCSIESSNTVILTASCSCNSSSCSAKLNDTAAYDSSLATGLNVKYTVTVDGNTSLSKQVNISVNPENDAPSFANTNSLSYSLTEDTPLNVSLTGAVDVESNGIAYTVESAPTKFSLNSCMGQGGSLDDDLTCTITPGLNEVGDYSFKYRGCESPALCSDYKTVNISITNVNDAPTINTATVTINLTEDTAINFNATEGLDVDTSSGDTLTYVVDTGLTLGALSSGCLAGNPADLTCTYNPTANSSGTDTLKYHVMDAAGLTSGITTMEFVIAEVNDAPTITNISNVVSNEGGSVTTDNFTVDEGGSTGENAQLVSIFVFSDNNTLLPANSIQMYYDNKTDSDPDITIETSYTRNGCDPVGGLVAFGNCNQAGVPNANYIPASVGVIYSDTALGGGCYKSTGLTSADWTSITCGRGFQVPVDGDDASAKNAFLKITGVGGQSGSANITVMAQDYDSTSNQVGTATTTFSYTVNPVSAIHGGWEHIRSKSVKKDRDGNDINKFSCTATVDQCLNGANTVDCTGAVSSTLPTDSAYTIRPKVENAIFLDTANNICYWANSSLDWVKTTNEVYLKWKDFSMLGTGSFSSATIIGWKVFRRKFGENYDLTKPINLSELSTSAREFTDVALDPRNVYFYTVMPINSATNSSEQLPTPTREVFSEIRLMTPPENMMFVHRWMVNQEVCGKMHMNTTSSPNATDPTSNFRCPYSGPGETVDGATFYDIGRDLLVDTFEAGCPYTRAADSATCGPNGCIGMSAPAMTPSAAGHVYYNRGNGTCYIADGIVDATSWKELSSYTIATAVNADQIALANLSINPLLPPIVNVRQEAAHKICDNRADLLAGAYTGIKDNLLFGLPGRKDQIAYSAWDSSISDSAIDVMETGQSISNISRCNSSSAGGVSGGYTNVSVPSSSYIYSIPGTQASGIRSIYTGSEAIGSLALTSSCVSRYGIQDVYGNVKEWVVDRMTCSDSTCQGTDDLNGNTISDDANDMNVNDTSFDIYKLDGVRGPCDDLNFDGTCNADDNPLDGWYFDEESFSAGRFIFPMGLPARFDYVTSFPTSSVADFLLDIGQTSGLTYDQLHDDHIQVNGISIENSLNDIGGISTGGSYLSGNKSGRYSMELLPTDIEPPSVKIGDVTYTMVNISDLSSTVTIQYSHDGALVPNASAIVNGDSITVSIKNGTTDAEDIKNAVVATASALVTATNDIADNNKLQYSGPKYTLSFDAKSRLYVSNKVYSDAPEDILFQPVDQKNITGTSINITDGTGAPDSLSGDTAKVVVTGKAVDVKIVPGSTNSQTIVSKLNNDITASKIVRATLKESSEKTTIFAGAKEFKNFFLESKLSGSAGNSTTLQLTSGGTAGSESVSVSGNSIIVSIENNVTTFDQLRSAIESDPIANNLVIMDIGDTSYGTGFELFTGPSRPLSGGSDFSNAEKVDVGFRCIVPIAEGNYAGE